MAPTLDCHLFFPPPWGLLHAVHLSLPLLRGHLERRGFDVAVTDLNLDVTNRLLAPEPLTQAAARIAGRLAGDGLDEASRELLETAAQAAPFVIDEIERAKRTLRNAIGRLPELVPAGQVVRLAGELVAAAGHPMLWNPLHGQYRAGELLEDFTLAGVFRGIARPELDPVEEALERSLEAALAGREARVYGIGCACSEQVYGALRLARWLRARSPEAVIVLGGAAIPFLRDAIHHFPELFDLVSACVIGDGEEPLAQLCEVARGERDLATVQNAHIRVDGAVRQTSELPWSAGFESPAAPVFDRAELARYFAPPTLPLLAARRCYWNKCTFCSITYDKRTPFGPQRVDPLVDQMREVAARTGCRTFTFVDEAVSAPQIRRLAAALIEGGDGFTWDALCRFEAKWDRATFDLAYRGGMRAIYFGLESGSQRVIDLMEKGFLVEVAERNLRDAHAAGIWTSCFAMVGFPGEEERDLEETIDFCHRNRAHLDSVVAGIFQCDLISPVANDPARFGLTVGELPVGTLDHRLPQVGRDALLERRIRRFREAVQGESFDHLNLYALNAGNLLGDLAARDRKAGFRAMQEAEVERLRAAGRLAAGGGAQRVRLAESVRVGAATSDGMTSALDLRSGAFVLLPSPVLERARAGSTLAGLADALAAAGEDRAVLRVLIAHALLVEESAAPLGAVSAGAS